MGLLRVALRLSTFTLVTLLAAFAHLLLLVPFWRSRQALADRVLHRWARMVSPILGMRVETEGPLPGHPCLLVSNHLGYLDIIALAHTQPLRFVSKDDVRDWPLMGPLVVSVRTLFIDRTRRTAVAQVNREIGAALGRGHGVVVFPEGTSSPGDDVLPFHASLLAAAQQASVPVCYAALTYHSPGDGSDPRESLCWWGGMEFFPHLINLLRIPSYTALVQFGPQPVAHMERKELARVLRDKVRALRTHPTVAEPRDCRPTAGNG